MLVQLLVSLILSLEVQIQVLLRWAVVVLAVASLVLVVVVGELVGLVSEHDEECRGEEESLGSAAYTHLLYFHLAAAAVVDRYLVWADRVVFVVVVVVVVVVAAAAHTV